MNKHSWKDDAPCLNMETNDFFENYEESIEHRKSIDSLCAECPLRRQCFAVGVSQKEWGVWGGVYLENGKISREFNRHNSKEDWSRKWQSLTMDG